MIGQEQIACPQCKAIDQQQPVRAYLARDRIGQIDGAFHRPPARPAIRPVPGDPVGHLFIERLRSGEVHQLTGVVFGELLGTRAFS